MGVLFRYLSIQKYTTAIHNNNNNNNKNNNKNNSLLYSHFAANTLNYNSITKFTIAYKISGDPDKF